ncbi:MAG: DUF72 domain-containing protein [Polyangiaceae bacterium]
MRSPKSSSATKPNAPSNPKLVVKKATKPAVKPGEKVATKPPKSAAKIPAARASVRALPKVDGIITVGCAGFPVPATRYFKEFTFVEVQETHVAVQGMGTIRRWKREAAPGFTFSILAPKEIGQEGFRDGKVVESALKAMNEVGRELSVKVAVFVSPAEFTSSRPNKLAVKEFLSSVKKKFGRVIWEAPPSWDIEEAEALATEAGAIASRDPLLAGLSKQPVAYYRLPGPAGHKSRYEDPAIERLAKLASEATHTDATYVFTNVDMFADAKRFKKSMKIP